MSSYPTLDSPTEEMNRKLFETNEQIQLPDLVNKVKLV